ncbi:hypothetical protein [Halorarum halobium]|uniref:hypothetical protein n=1 Tax=Halorarum halobium TaxID=3075121 RepID=UPI0028B1CD57|nr:hypothetical protein [Halobaculum sp. XH14]
MSPPRADDGDHSPPGPDADRPVGTDGGDAGPGFDEAALYLVVREAVEDAILGVLGTLLLVGVAFVLIWAGVVSAMSAGAPVGYAVGGAIALLGFYIAAATLEVIPPVRDWF